MIRCSTRSFTNFGNRCHETYTTHCLHSRERRSGKARTLLLGRSRGEWISRSSRRTSSSMSGSTKTTVSCIFPPLFEFTRTISLRRVFPFVAIAHTSWGLPHGAPCLDISHRAIPRPHYPVAAPFRNASLAQATLLCFCSVPYESLSHYLVLRRPRARWSCHSRLFRVRHRHRVPHIQLRSLS